mmetsp:Transcript_35/g.35  ORF Transcript_35/g.35 Transcript_35/m.35 type:complete len:107 (+) Transcript_35:1110-1430(+)
MNIATKSIVGVSILLVIVSWMLNASSMASVWAMINQLQMLMLLLLSGVFIPKDIADFITASKLALFSFNFIHFEEVTLFKRLFNWLDYEQPDFILSKIDLESGSTF